MIDVKRDRLDYIYEQNKAQALRSEYENKFKLEARIARELSQFIRGNLLFFQEYEKVILYYDNGQQS